jgi:metal-responsive CopG/Arc/MetJ family transcriptional regulator
MVDPRQQISRSSIIRDAITALINANVLWDEIEKWDEETPKHELIGVAINLKKNVKTTLGSVDNRSAFVRYAIWKYFDGRA